MHGLGFGVGWFAADADGGEWDVTVDFGRL